MELQTVVKCKKPDFQVDYATRMMMLGSCFAENVGAKLQYFKFKTDINPCGIVYNPMSVAGVLRLLLDGKSFTKEDLLQNEGRWISLSHHGRFSSVDADVCLQQINTRLKEAVEHLKNTDLLIITWGTAWVYRHLATGKIVSNCHKLPATDFERFRLEVGEIEKEYIDLLDRLRNVRPNLRILLTISPIRHWKDGAHGNQLSKSVLLLATEKLARRESNVYYFPAYEIVMDELRDYRFYAGDMLHLSEEAIEYIWEKFQSVYMDASAIAWMRRIDKVNKALAHRPVDPDAPAYQNFLHQTFREREEIERTLGIVFD